MKRDITVIWRRALPLMAVALLSLTLGSCTKEPLLSGEQQIKEYMDFSLELTPPGAYTPTKAMTTAQQNAINRAEVLVFQNSVLLYHKTGTVTDIDGVKKRVQVNLKTSQTETELFDIMVIGNAPTLDFAPYVGKTKDELKAAFNVSSSGKWAGSEFVMYGEALQKLIKPITNFFKIQMLRSLARIDVGVGAYDEATDSWAGLTGVFTLTEVRVINSRDKFAAIPSSTSFNASGNVKVSSPTIPAGTRPQGTTAADALTYSGADITNGIQTKSSIFIAEAPNTTNRVTILVGGSYRGGATTYYRVDMCVPNTTTPGAYDYFNILRNHLYRITITSVSGAGFTDAQEALISAPINITTTLTPIAEGGAGGDIVFDGKNYIMTDASSVLIYGEPDGVKTYKVVTVKASIAPGVAATVSGTGLTAPINLTNGVEQPIDVALAPGTTSGSLIVKVGRLIKTIPFTVQPPIDAHFDFLPFANVTSMTITHPQPWITLSQNMTYLPSEQQSLNIVGNAQNKAYVHFDENIATSGAPRMAQALLLRNNSNGTVRIVFEQRNLNGMVIGYFGGAKDDYGYTKQVAVESIEEYAVRVYDDTSIGTVQTGMYWGFNNITTNVINKVVGTANTISLAKRTDSGIPGPYTIYNNYSARYCYDKNRDANGNGSIDESEVVWYLPAQNQLMAVWIANTAVTKPFTFNVYYNSATEHDYAYSWPVHFGYSYTYRNPKADLNQVRCVREL